MTTTLCAIMKNEEHYVIEWIAYHKLIGFDRIVIYENDSSDATPAILEALADNDLIQGYVPWRDVMGSPQLTAYDDAVKKCNTDWIMFLDTDEFLNIYSRTRVNDFLSQFNSDVVGVAINWRIFGSGGQLQQLGGSVLERFTRAALPTANINHHVKSFIKPAFVEHIHMHAAKMKDGRFVTASGKPLNMRRQGISDEVDFTIAQVNHYFTKSRDEYGLKVERGNVNRKNNDPDKFAKYTSEMFQAHDLNDCEDTSITWAVPEVVSRTVEIGKIAHLSLQSRR